jgi:hypothetical protein
MSLLSLPVVYILVGCLEWWLSLRRTLACARGERTVLVCIVFIENLLGLWVLQNFIRNDDWLIAVSYSVGGSLGAFLVSFSIGKEKETSAAD